MDRLAKQELEGNCMMDELEEMIHFSHGHVLSLSIPSEEEDKEEDDASCSICGLPILSSPSYKCTALDCKYFLHKQCALKFPPELLHPSYCPHSNKGHFLSMMYMPSPSSSSDFTYFCEACEAEIHPLSAGLGVEIEIKHRSHPSHPLVATCKEVWCECDGCGREHKGFFFTCRLCNFWIHRDCTQLPKITTLPKQPEPFYLVYSLSPYQIAGNCVVCRIPLPMRSINFGVYFCPHSRTFAHIACGTRYYKYASKTREELILQLPDDEQGDQFPSRVIRRYAETNPLGPGAYYKRIFKTSSDLDDGAADLKIERYHKQHPLILAPPAPPHDDDDDDATIPAACDLCTQPITSSSSSSSSSHRCLDLDCRFAAHKICADALPNIDKFFIPYGLDAIRTDVFPGKRFFNSVFYCIFCRRPCNGVCSRFHFNGARYIDLECMAALVTVNHASHPHHLLFRTHHNPSAPTPLSCCPADTFLYDVYRCFICNYSIHMSCAMLPKRNHFREYHRRHPLHLIYTSNTTAASDDFCEVCEEVIDFRYWMYRCVECDESYHISCIPSVGYLSKVKFGGSLTLPFVHDHPLTLERMLTVPSQRCGGCKEIIRGMVDEMAFFCSLCHFWLHFSCAAGRHRLQSILALFRCYLSAARQSGRERLQSILALFRCYASAARQDRAYLEL